MVQFVAFYRAQGVDHFAFYNASADAHLAHFFALSSHFVHLYSFQKSFSLEEKNFDDQLTSVAHCRLTFPRSQLLLVDVDEFVVPRLSLSRLLADHNKSDVAALIVPQTMLCSELNPVTFPQIFHSFVRGRQIWPHGFRSKTILLRPERVSQPGIHDVKGVTRGYRVVNVDESDAVLFHYRSCCGQRTKYWIGAFSVRTLATPMVQDRRMLLFTNVTSEVIRSFLKSEE